MNIVLLRDKIRYDGGGASRSIHLLAEELTTRGNDVEVITVHFSGEPNHVPTEYNYTLTEKPITNRTQVDGAFKIRRILNEIESVDVVHCFQPQLHPIVGEWKQKNPETAVVGRLNTYENFCTNHSLIDNECYKKCSLTNKWRHHPNPSASKLAKMAFDTWIQPTLLNEFDRLFALSPAVAEIFDGYGVDTSRLEVIPNFYEPSFSEFNNNKKMGNHTDKEYRIIYVGRLVEKKGVDLLLDAVENSAADLEVDIVGDGPERNSLQRDSPENFTFHGWVDHNALPAYYEQADVFVHPGLWPEPFGRTVLEAMQCGCVPVVSDVGGPPWIIGEAGLTFSKRDVAGMSSKLDYLSDHKKWNKYRKKTPIELERFKPERVVDMIESTYNSITE